MTTDDPLTGYCDYLDKEMTIMGLLSAFSVAVPAFVLDRTAGANPNDQEVLANLWRDGRLLLLAGSVALLLAALSFYLQRSLLAYYYGQLRFSKTPAAYTSMPTESLLEEVDSWATWTRYTTGFVLLALGFIYYGVALFAPGLSTTSPVGSILVPAVPGVLFIAVHSVVMNKHEFSDSPWRDFFRFGR